MRVVECVRWRSHEELSLEGPAVALETCPRCSTVYPLDANYCSQCGLVRSTPSGGYHHPEKLLPGPPLRHHAELAAPIGPPSQTLRPKAEVCELPSTMRSATKAATRKPCPPGTVGPLGPVCG